MSFDLSTTKSHPTSIEQVCCCLEAWATQIEETEDGSMKVMRNGEIVEIEVSSKSATLYLKFIGIQIEHAHHTSDEYHAGWLIHTKYFNAQVRGLDPDGNACSLSLLIKQVNEAGAPWFSTFSFTQSIV